MVAHIYLASGLQKGVIEKVNERQKLAVLVKVPIFLLDISLMSDVKFCSKPRKKWDSETKLRLRNSNFT